jgi:NDP-sugar pyrophosphorylase family protein
MLPLGNKPIIAHNIDRLISFGIKKIYIAVKYLGEQIEAYFGDGSDRGISIGYIWEDQPLGTAGALALIENITTEHILLMNSDLFTNVDLEDMYQNLVQSKADMVVASTEYKIDIPYAILEEEERQVKRIAEKPSYVYHSNAGIYMLSKALVNQIPKQQFYDITDVMDDILDRGQRLVHVPIRGYWIDIGSPADYKRAQDFIKHQ